MVMPILSCTLCVCCLFINWQGVAVTLYRLEVENLYSGTRLPPYVIHVL